MTTKTYKKLLEKTSPEFINELSQNFDLICELARYRYQKPLPQLLHALNQNVVPEKSQYISHFSNCEIAHKIVNDNNFSVKRKVSAMRDLYNRYYKYKICLKFNRFTIYFHQYYNQGSVNTFINVGDHINDDLNLNIFYNVNVRLLKYLEKICSNLELPKDTPLYKIYTTLWNLATFGTDIDSKSNNYDNFSEVNFLYYINKCLK